MAARLLDPGPLPKPRGPTARTLREPIFGERYALQGANPSDQGDLCDLNLASLLAESAYYGGSWVLASREQIGSFAGASLPTLSDALVVCRFASGGTTSLVEFDAGQSVQVPGVRVTCRTQWARVESSDGQADTAHFDRPDETVVSLAMIRGASVRHATRTHYFNQVDTSNSTLFSVTNVPPFATGVAVQSQMDDPAFGTPGRILPGISPTSRLRFLTGLSANQILGEYHGGELAQTWNRSAWLPVPEGAGQFQLLMPPVAGGLTVGLTKVVFRIQL